MSFPLLNTFTDLIENLHKSCTELKSDRNQLSESYSKLDKSFETCFYDVSYTCEQTEECQYGRPTTFSEDFQRKCYSILDFEIPYFETLDLVQKSLLFKEFNLFYNTYKLQAFLPSLENNSNHWIDLLSYLVTFFTSTYDSFDSLHCSPFPSPFPPSNKVSSLQLTSVSAPLCSVFKSLFVLISSNFEITLNTVKLLLDHPTFLSLFPNLVPINFIISSKLNKSQAIMFYKSCLDLSLSVLKDDVTNTQLQSNVCTFLSLFDSNLIASYLILSTNQNYLSEFSLFLLDPVVFNTIPLNIVRVILSLSVNVVNLIFKSEINEDLFSISCLYLEAILVRPDLFNLLELVSIDDLIPNFLLKLLAKISVDSTLSIDFAVKQLIKVSRFSCQSNSHLFNFLFKILQLLINSDQISSDYLLGFIVNICLSDIDIFGIYSETVLKFLQSVNTLSWDLSIKLANHLLINSYALGISFISSFFSQPIFPMFSPKSIDSLVSSYITFTRSLLRLDSDLFNRKSSNFLKSKSFLKQVYFWSLNFLLHLLSNYSFKELPALFNSKFENFKPNLLNISQSIFDCFHDFQLSLCDSNYTILHLPLLIINSFSGSLEYSEKNLKSLTFGEIYSTLKKFDQLNILTKFLSHFPLPKPLSFYVSPKVFQSFSYSFILEFSTTNLILFPENFLSNQLVSSFLDPFPTLLPLALLSSTSPSLLNQTISFLSSPPFLFKNDQILVSIDVMTNYFSLYGDSVFLVSSLYLFATSLYELKAFNSSLKVNQNDWSNVFRPGLSNSDFSELSPSSVKFLSPTILSINTFLSFLIEICQTQSIIDCFLSLIFSILDSFYRTPLFVLGSFNDFIFELKSLSVLKKYETFLSSLQKFEDYFLKDTIDFSTVDCDDTLQITPYCSDSLFPFVLTKIGEYLGLNFPCSSNNSSVTPNQSNLIDSSLVKESFQIIPTEPDYSNHFNCLISSVADFQSFFSLITKLYLRFSSLLPSLYSYEIIEKDVKTMCGKCVEHFHFVHCVLHLGESKLVENIDVELKNNRKELGVLFNKLWNCLDQIAFNLSALSISFPQNSLQIYYNSLLKIIPTVKVKFIAEELGKLLCRFQESLLNQGEKFLNSENIISYISVLHHFSLINLDKILDELLDIKYYGESTLNFLSFPGLTFELSNQINFVDFGNISKFILNYSTHPLFTSFFVPFCNQFNEEFPQGFCLVLENILAVSSSIGLSLLINCLENLKLCKQNVENFLAIIYSFLSKQLSSEVVVFSKFGGDFSLNLFLLSKVLVSQAISLSHKSALFFIFVSCEFFLNQGYWCASSLTGVDQSAKNGYNLTLNHFFDWVNVVDDDTFCYMFSFLFSKCDMILDSTLISTKLPIVTFSHRDLNSNVFNSWIKAASYYGITELLTILTLFEVKTLEIDDKMVEFLFSICVKSLYNYRVQGNEHVFVEVAQLYCFNHNSLLSDDFPSVEMIRRLRPSLRLLLFILFLNEKTLNSVLPHLLAVDYEFFVEETVHYQHVWQLVCTRLASASFDSCSEYYDLLLKRIQFSGILQGRLVSLLSPSHD
ncbi:hypothetical protein RCL1_003011 [Eukaryota sp. TZLM3-RCL]